MVSVVSQAPRCARTPLALTAISTSSSSLLSPGFSSTWMPPACRMSLQQGSRLSLISTFCSLAKAMVGTLWGCRGPSVGLPTKRLLRAARRAKCCQRGTFVGLRCCLIGSHFHNPTSFPSSPTPLARWVAASPGSWPPSRSPPPCGRGDGGEGSSGGGCGGASPSPEHPIGSCTPLAPPSCLSFPAMERQEGGCGVPNG